MPTPVQMLESEIRKVIRRSIAESDLTYNQVIAVLEMEKFRLMQQAEREADAEGLDRPYPPEKS